jgi:hypothetical protein
MIPSVACDRVVLPSVHDDRHAVDRDRACRVGRACQPHACPVHFGRRAWNRYGDDRRADQNRDDATASVNAIDERCFANSFAL